MSEKPYEDRVKSTEAERIAIVAAKLAVTDAMTEMWAAFGVDRSNFESIEAFKSDLRFVRQVRKRDGIWHDLDFIRTVRNGSVSAGRRFVLAVVLVIATSFAVGAGSALKDWVVFLTTGRH